MLRILILISIKRTVESLIHINDEKVNTYKILNEKRVFFFLPTYVVSIVHKVVLCLFTFCFLLANTIMYNTIILQI